MTHTKEVTLRDAAHEISLHCDGAVENDGMGYNKFDSRFMSDLLSQPTWTDNQKRAVYDVIKKYKDQLNTYGIKLDSIVDIPEEKEDIVRFYSENGNVYVQFEYDEELKDKIKEKFIWDPHRKEWWTKFVDDELFAWINEFRTDWKDHKVVCDLEEGNKEETKVEKNKDIIIKKLSEGTYSIDLEYGCDNFDSIKDDILKPAGCQFNGDTKEWVYEDDIQYLLDLLEPYEDQIDVAFDVQIQAKETESEFVEPDGFQGELYPFQKETCEFALKHKKVLVADQMGLGKTVSSLATLESAEAFPSLIVVPSAVKYNWKKEIENFIPHRKVYVIDGMDDQVPKNEDIDIFIVNYYILSEYVDDLKDNFDFNSLVLDEVHRCKNSDAKRTKAVKAFEKVQNPEFILQLTGTPFPNHPKELSQPLKILNRLSYFGGWKDYVTTYCGARYVNRPYGSFWEFEDDPANLPNLEDLGDKLKEKIMVRHTKEEVVDELPEKRRSFVPLQIDREAYLKKEKDTLEQIKKDHQEKVSALEAELGRIDPTSEEWEEKKNRLDNLIEFGPAEELNLINQLRRYLSKQKVDQIQSWVQDFIDNNEKIILFGHHQEALEKVYQKFEDVAVKVTGETNSAKREENVERFQNDEDTLLFVGNMQAASEGITLTEASNVAFIEFSWVPSHIEQAEARAYARLNDIHGINSFFFFVEDTVDEAMMELLDNKQKLFDEVIEQSGEENGFMNESEVEEKGLEYVLKQMEERHLTNA